VVCERFGFISSCLKKLDPRASLRMTTALYCHSEEHRSSRIQKNPYSDFVLVYILTQNEATCFLPVVSPRLDRGVPIAWILGSSPRKTVKGVEGKRVSSSALGIDKILLKF